MDAMVRKSRKRNISCAIATDDTIWDIWKIQTGDTKQDWIKIRSLERLDYGDDDLYPYLFKLNNILGEREDYERRKTNYLIYKRDRWIWFKIIYPLTNPIDNFLYNLRIEIFGK